MTTLCFAFLRFPIFFKRWRLTVLVSVGLLFASSGSSFAAEVKFELLIPTLGTTIFARHPETHLILRSHRQITSVRVRKNSTGEEFRPVVSMEGQDYFYVHFTVPLNRGANQFTILPGQQLVEFNYQKIQSDVSMRVAGIGNVDLFHQGEKLPQNCQECHTLQDTEMVGPPIFRKDESCLDCHKRQVANAAWRHAATENKQCLSCHLQSIEPLRIGFPKEKIQEVCFGCHTTKQSWFSKSSLHGPLVVGGCTLCHNPHGEEHRYQLWSEGSLELCLACHGDKNNLVTKNFKKRVPYVHGIIFGQGCTACHDPHATNHEYTLHKTINKLCQDCHSGSLRETRGHPVAGHPVVAAKNPSDPNRKLTCISCHNPHGSSYKSLLVETKQGGRLCRVCHSL